MKSLTKCVLGLVLAVFCTCTGYAQTGCNDDILEIMEKTLLLGELHGAEVIGAQESIDQINQFNSLMDNFLNGLRDMGMEISEPEVETFAYYEIYDENGLVEAGETTIEEICAHLDDMILFGFDCDDEN